MKSFLEFIYEMAHNIGEHSYSPLKSERERKSKFNNSVGDKIHNKLSDYLIIHKTTNGNSTLFHTNDHSTAETLHSSLIKHKQSSKEFPFDHIIQEEVDRKPGGILHKGYAVDFLYNHFNDQHLPLVSSETQYRKGHELWRKLVHKALDNGHHVYHWDGSKLHKSNKNNVEQHLNSSFGKYGDESYANKHMVISKNELK